MSLSFVVEDKNSRYVDLFMHSKFFLRITMKFCLSERAVRVSWPNEQSDFIIEEKFPVRLFNK